MRETWRWFGPDDPVSLDNAKQAGAQGIVTALHHIYDGRAWSDDDVAARKRAVEAAGLTWDVCESIPVSAAIKLRAGALPARHRRLEGQPRQPRALRRRDRLLQLHAGRRLDADRPRLSDVVEVGWRCASTCRPSSPTTSSSCVGRAPKRDYSAAALAAARARSRDARRRRPWRRSRRTSSAACRRARPNTPAQGFAEALRRLRRPEPTPISGPISSPSSPRSRRSPRHSERGWRSTPTIRRSRCSACRASSRPPTIIAPCSPPSRRQPTA